MKVTIIKKSVKEGETSDGRAYSIKSLFVKFTERDVYNRIVSHLTKKGAESDKIEKFIKESEYKGEPSFSFGLGCSRFTFEHVQAFGTIDAQIEFDVNDRGFCNAKIKVVDRKEQIVAYEPPTEREEEVDGWEIEAPEKPAKDEATEQQASGVAYPTTETVPFSAPTSGDTSEADLPF